MLEKLVYGAGQMGLFLTSRQTEQFQLYYEELLEWNKKVNLTAITEYEEVQLKHFLDSLTMVPALENEPWIKGDFLLLDVGTGAGMPGVPLKIFLPKVRLVLLESVAKKTAFLQYLIERLGLENVDILTGRAEDIARKENCREKFDLVVTRAVGKLPTVAELCLPFCHEGGLFVAMKMGDIQDEIDKAERAIGILGGRLSEVKEINVEGLERRFLVVIEKTSSTPSKYPRRTGIPFKRPL